MEFLEFSGPRIFLSWNVPSGNFLSRDFVSRKILAFVSVSLLFVLDCTFVHIHLVLLTLSRVYRKDVLLTAAFSRLYHG